MKKGIITGTLFVLGFCLPKVNAEIVQVPLNCAGTYDINSPYQQIDFDLGVTFTEISHVYIDWSGQITAGLAIYYSDPENPFPVDVEIRASLGSNPWPRLTYVRGGKTTYPDPMFFDTLSEFDWQDSTWSDLLDGEGTIRVSYIEPIIGDGRVETSGTIILNNASLVVDGTVVPEPATYLLFTIGIAGIRLVNSKISRRL